MERLYIFGAGGHAAEALMSLRDSDHFFGTNTEAVLVVDDHFYTGPELLGAPIIKRSEWRPDAPAVIAIGDPRARQSVAESLPAGTIWGRIIHPTAVISDRVTLDDGAIISAFCVLTCDAIGSHASLNPHVTISHDCRIGDYFFAAAGAKISGNVIIGDRVSVGANAAIREKIKVGNDVTIGLCAGVVTDLEPGVYAGVPARRIK